MHSTITQSSQSDQLKGELLQGSGYHFNFEMESYVNRKSKKVFSAEYVDDHDEAEIERCIKSPSPESGWTFFFNEQPTEAMRPLLERTYDTGVRVRT